MERKSQQDVDGLVCVAHFMMIVTLVLLLILKRMCSAVLRAKSKAIHHGAGRTSIS
jgi:ABC-type sulfate transport system permease component